MRSVFVGLVVLLGASCAQADRANDVARPAFVLKDVDQACVRDLLVTAVAPAGWTLKSGGDTEFVFQKRADPAIAAVMQQRSNATWPEERLVTTLRRDDGGLGVFFEVWVVANPGSPRQSSVKGQVALFDETTAGRLATAFEARCGKKG